MSTTIVEHKLIEWTRKVAGENPDFVYEQITKENESGYKSRSCLYVHDGKPSCLIGHAAIEAGIIDLSIEFTGNNLLEACELVQNLGIVDQLSHAEIKWLNAAQNAQDTGQTWAEAIKSADEARAEYVEAELECDDDD